MAKPLLPLGTFARGDIVAGRYEVRDVLATGGQGECYEVVQTFTKQVGVLKVLLTDLRDSENPEFAARVQRESERLGRLNHPNIVQVRDGGLTDGPNGAPFFVMQKLDGCTLQEIAGGFGTLHPHDACHFGADISHALWAIHQHNLIHGDVKPDNLFVHVENENARIVVLDLGITVASQGPDTPAAILALTPPFSSPEHFEGFVTPRSDLYCLGIVLYMALTGEHPYNEGTTDEYYESAHLSKEKRPRSFAVVNPALQIPAELEALVMQLLEKDPARRPTSAFAANAVFKALLKQIPPAEPGRGVAVSTPLIRYVTSQHQATNLPSGPKSVPWRKGGRFIPFGPTTPGTVAGTAIAARRDTIDVTVRDAAPRASFDVTQTLRLVDNRSASAAALAEPQPAEAPPKPLFLIDTQPFALRAPSSDVSRTGPATVDRGPSPLVRKPMYADTDPSGPPAEWLDRAEVRGPSELLREGDNAATSEERDGDAPEAIVREDPATRGRPSVEAQADLSDALASEVSLFPPWVNFVFPGLDRDWLLSAEEAPLAPVGPSAPVVPKLGVRPNAGMESAPVSTAPRVSAEAGDLIADAQLARRRQAARSFALVLLAIIVVGTALGLCYRLGVNRFGVKDEFNGTPVALRVQTPRGSST